MVINNGTSRGQDEFAIEVIIMKSTPHSPEFASRNFVFEGKTGISNEKSKKNRDRVTFVGISAWIVNLKKNVNGFISR